MGILLDTLLQESKRPVVVKDCVSLVDSEVAAKTGMTGMIVKTGYKAFKAIKPTIVETAVETLLNDFAKVLDKHYDTYLAAYPDKSKSFDQWAAPRDKEMANDLLGVTDDIMNRSSKVAIKKIYSSLRHIAEKNVAEAVPGIGRLVVKHLG